MALRIERMRLGPWGCFEDHTLTFSLKLGDVDLIYGLNASGKSTTSRGQRSLLYGIEERTPDNHTYDYADLCISASLQLDGKSIEVSRRKRRVGSLVGPDGEALPDELILPALGGLTEEVYRALFQVDHETLVQGGVELLQGRGEIGASLFAAAAGIASLHGTLADFDLQAERLFNPRGRTSLLHKALAELRSAEKRLRDATFRPVHYREMARGLRKAEATCDALSEQIRELEVEVRKLERRRATAPLIDAHAERLAELDALADTPDIPDSAVEKRSAAQGRVGVGTAAIQRLKGSAQNLDAQIAAIEVDDAVISRGDQIRALKERVALISKAAGDRRKREGELQEARTDLKTAAAIANVPPEQLESLRRPATARRALDLCLREHGELNSRRASAQARLDDAEHAVDQARLALNGAPNAPDIRELEAVITAALKAVPLSEQIEVSSAEADLSLRQATERLNRLHPAPPSIDALRALSTPPREQTERAAARSRDLRGSIEGLDADKSRITSAESELLEERERLAMSGEAPTATALARARAARDRRWSAIRTAVGGGSQLKDQDADGFERSRDNADRIADARTDRAAHIERSAALEARAAALERERAELAAREAELRHCEAAVADEWSRAWAITGLATIDSEDAGAWLDERDLILGLLDTADHARMRADTLRERERSHLDALREQLRRHAPEVEAELPLDTLIAHAQRTVHDVAATARERASAESDFKSAQQALARAKREQKAADQAWAKWENTWPQRRQEAGLPPAATPEAAQEVVRAIDDGLAHIKRISDLERRIAGIDSDQTDFETRVHTLCGDVSPELAALDAERAIALLHDKLSDHERRRSRRNGLIEQRGASDAERESIEADVGDAQAEIDAALAAAGCSDISQLPEIEGRASRVRAVRIEVAEIEKQISRIGEGRFSELLAEAADFDRDRATQEVAGLHEQIEELRAERDQLKEQIGQRKRELLEAETDTAAVQASQDVELARAAVQEAARAHAKAALAAAVVRRAIDRYRRLHQGPMVDRANQLFTRFTHGSFVELFVDLERGQGVLIGRQRDRVLKRVPEMSKGTREQLFLALRIAAIERYISTSGPLPVIFDDVFIESDEPRSERIFEALGELAMTTQVIVLTHHHHLIEVGRRALKDRLIVQDLPDGAPTLRQAAAA